jgi:hypothetical protein
LIIDESYRYFKIKNKTYGSVVILVETPRIPETDVFVITVGPGCSVFYITSYAFAFAFSMKRIPERRKIPVKSRFVKEPEKIVHVASSSGLLSNAQSQRLLLANGKSMSGPVAASEAKARAQIPARRCLLT